MAATAKGTAPSPRDSLARYAALTATLAHPFGDRHQLLEDAELDDGQWQDVRASWQQRMADEPQLAGQFGEAFRKARAELEHVYQETMLQRLPAAFTRWHTDYELSAWLSDWLRDQLEAGLLVAVRRVSFGFAPQVVVPKKPSTWPPVGPGPLTLRDTYIGIELVDQQGKAVPNERYEIELPDGVLRQGALDDKGRVHLEPVMGGTCHLRLSDIDGREWTLGGSPPSQDPGAEGVERYHKVQAGEWLGQLAWTAGFRDPDTVWLHPANAALRQSRLPDLLHPGDSVAIPAIVVREEAVVTGRSHRLVVRLRQHWLRLHLHRERGTPLTDVSYSLLVDGALVASEVPIGPNGFIEQPLPATARRATVRIGDTALQLRVGGLNPTRDAPDDGISGAQARLTNLGYGPGPADGVLGPRTQAALRRFQTDENLEPSATLTPQTRARLEQRHGC